MSEQSKELNLPPLPEPDGAIDVDLGPAGPEYMEGARRQGVADGYSAEQMHEYALAAIKNSAEPSLPAIPKTPQEVIDFIGGNFNSMTKFSVEGSLPLEDVRYSLTVHDLLSAFYEHLDLPSHDDILEKAAKVCDEAPDDPYPYADQSEFCAHAIRALKSKQENEDLCDSCNKNKGFAPHTCPFREEIRNSKVMCNCCTDCTHDCAMDI